MGTHDVGVDDGVGVGVGIGVADNAAHAAAQTHSTVPGTCSAPVDVWVIVKQFIGC